MKSHILTKKTTKRKRHLRKSVEGLSRVLSHSDRNAAQLGRPVAARQ